MSAGKRYAWLTIPCFVATHYFSFFLSFFFFFFTYFYSTVLPQANHELALQDAAKKANKQRGEIEEQIADMKVLMVIDM